MQSQLPKPDTVATFRAPQLETLLSEEGKEVKLSVEAFVGHSDIKWNDFAGKLTASMYDKKTGIQGRPLFTVQLVHFTGNCGVKALSHFWALPKLELTALKVIESFAYHKTNCGLLIGSDTVAKSYKGTTATNVGKDKNYHFSEPTWNPNYTWAKEHTIALFWKDLNSSTHEDGWVQETKGT